MGLQITIGVSGQKEIDRILAIRADAVRDLRPAWDRIEKHLQLFQKKVFMNKGGHSGLERWKPLKPATIKQKRRIAPRWAEYPLIRTQKLMKGWTDPKSEGAVRMKEKLFFAYGIDEFEIPYAVFHQLGGPVIPKREHLRLPDSVRRSIVKTIQAHLVKTGQFIRETIF